MQRKPSAMPIAFNGRARRPPQPRPSAVEPTVPPGSDEIDDELTAAVDEEPVLSDEFLRQLRGDVEGVREGRVPSIIAAQRPSPKDRPRSRRYKRRDKHGNAF